VHEKELLALAHSVRQWGHHLQDVQHTVAVLTDHVTLKYFHKQPKLSRRQVRWTELFAEYDFDIKSGRENIVPDALSRIPDLQMGLCASFNSSPLSNTDFICNLRVALPHGKAVARMNHGKEEVLLKVRCNRHMMNLECW
jgi:hypothetical protein